MKSVKIFLAVLITFFSAYTFSSASEIKSPSEYIINKAAELLEKGDFLQACELLESVNPDEYSPRLTFLKGQCKFKLQDYSAAAFLYELMLDKNTNLPRVRLELARTLNSMGKNKKAKHEYLKVLEQNIPDQVRKNILKQIEQIDHKQKWGGILSFGYLYDSNVNAAPVDPNIMAFGQPFVLDSDSTEKEDSAAAVSMSAGRFFNGPLADEWRVDFYGNLLSYGSQTEYSTYSIGASAGPHYNGNYQWAFPLSINQTWEDNKQANRSVSFSPAVGVPLRPGILLSSRLQFQHMDDLRDADEANGLSIMWSYNMKFQINQDQILECGATIVDNNANDFDYNRFRSATLNLGYHTRYKDLFGLSLLPSFTRVRYDEADPIDNGEKRSDNRYGITTNLYKDFIVYNTVVTPVLTYTFTKNNSNIDRRDYDRNQASLMVRIEF